MPTHSSSLFRTLLSSPRTSKWIRPLLLIAAMSIIYFLGTSLFSAPRMKRLLDPRLSAAFQLHSETQLLHYDYIIRWSAHYLEYFVAFLFLVWALRLRPLTALLLAVALAVADEGHQYFLPDRTCSLFDVKLDAAGAATAFILTVAIRFMRGSSRLVPVVAEGQGSAAPRPGTSPFKSSN